MIFSELQTRLAQILHRPDLTSDMVNFAADATERINRRLNLQLVAPVLPDDTNEVLTSYPLLYIYGSLTSAYEFLNNGDNAKYYNDAWEVECDRQNVTQAALTDPYATVPPVMTGGV